MKLKSVKVQKVSEKVRNLYCDAFPQIERISEKNLEKGLGRGANIREYYDNDTFIGFTYDYVLGDMVYLGYFATVPSVRGKGYGKQILDAFRSFNIGKKIFLLVESLDSNASNIEMRRRRVNFYLRNGCRDSQFLAKSDGEWYGCLYMQGVPTREEVYNAINRFESIYKEAAS